MINIYLLNVLFLSIGWMVFVICFVFAVSTCLFIINYIKKKLHFKLELERMEHQFQKQLLAATIYSQEAERKRMARDLHDDIGPLLSLAYLYIDSIGEQVVEKGNAFSNKIFDETKNLLKTAVAQAQRITFDMTPHTLDLLGLPKTLTELLRRVGDATKINTTATFEQPDLNLEGRLQIMAFRIVNETLNNIVKHSNATFIHITQYVHNERYIIEVSHDGRGLEQNTFERLLKESNGMGLKNISSRLQASNGNVRYFKSEEVYFTAIALPLTPEPVNE